MTDKTKILAEIERLKMNWRLGMSAEAKYRVEAYTELIDFINSLPEELVRSIWHDASEPPIIDKTFLLVAPNGNSSLCLWGGKELHSVTIGGGHSVLCKGDIYSYIDDLLNLDNSCNFGKNLQEEPVSEDIEEAAKRYALNNTPYEDCTDEMSDAFKAGAKWHREQMMAKAIDGKVLINGMCNPILHLWDKGRHLIDKKVKVIVIKEG